MVAVREFSGLIPGRGGAKTFVDVGDYLTASVSERISKDSGSILLNTQFKAKNNIATFLTNTIHDKTGSCSAL